jgi:hypothetical protein
VRRHRVVAAAGRARALLAVLCLVAAISCTKAPDGAGQPALDQHSLVPVPVSVQAAKGTWFTLGEATKSTPARIR